jgi:hypothetical protein
VEPRLELKTVSVRPDGCFSVLLWDGRPFAVSVERTFDDGRPVIGAGDYDCVPSFYVKGGYATFEIIVAGHTRVLFHKGNTEIDSMACVVVAESFAVMNDMTAVQDSKHGFEEFMALAGAAPFKMRVTGR